MKQCSGGGIECWLQEKSLRGRGWCTPWIGTSSERWRMSDSSSRRTRAARGVARCSLRKATLRKGDGGALLRGALSRRSRRLWMTPRCATRREDCCCRHILGRLGRALTQRALGALGRRQAEAQEVEAGGRVGGWRRRRRTRTRTRILAVCGWRDPPRHASVRCPRGPTSRCPCP